MRFLVIFHAAVVGLSMAAIWFLKGHAEAWQFFGGGCIAAFSLLFAYMLTKLILGKKSVAMAVSLIVLKYPILGMFLFVAAVRAHWDLIWVSAGLMSAIVTGWVAGLYFHLQAGAEETSPTPD